MNEYNVFIDSAKAVKKALEDGLIAAADEIQIRRIMREELSMKYRKIIKVSVHGNSDKNLVLR